MNDRRRTSISRALLIRGYYVEGLIATSRSVPVVGGADVPRFEFDPAFPNLPLPNEWIFGELGGVGVDAQDHVWVIQRPWTVIDRELGAVAGISACCRPAPPVVEFDFDGNVIQAWAPLQSFEAKAGTPAGQGFEVGANGAVLWEARPGPYGEWGRREHTVYIDHRDNVWVSNDTQLLGRPAGLVVDREANELFVADGYTNKRVIVFDAATGAYRRHWGAYGNRPEDTDLGPYDPAAPPARQFRGPVHGIALSRDGLLYVTDRSGDRIQVFRRNGEFVREAFVAPAHSMAVDSRGNIYIGETRGRRVQRFLLVPQ